MKRTSLLLPAAFALLAGLMAAPARAAEVLYVRDVKIESGGVELTSGQKLVLTSSSDEITFKVLLGSKESGSSGSAEGLAPTDVINVTGSPTLQFFLHKIGSTTQADGKGDHVATFTEADYETISGSRFAVLRFTYSPSGTDLGQSPYFGGTNNGIQLNGGSITLTTSDGTIALGTGKTAQGFTNALSASFASYSSGVEINAYAVSPEASVASGITLEMGTTRSFQVNRDGPATPNPLTATSSDTSKVTIAADNETEAASGTGSVTFTVTPVAIGTATVTIKANGNDAFKIPVTVTAATTAAPLRLHKIVVLGTDGEPLPDGQELAVTSKADALSFKVLVGWADGTTANPFPSYDDAETFAVAGSPTLNFYMRKIGSDSAGDGKTIHQAKYMLCDYEEDETGKIWGVMWFDYSPEADDFGHAPFFKTGSYAYITPNGTISATVNGGLRRLQDTYNRQGGAAITSAFGAQAAGVSVNMFAVALDATTAAGGVTVIAGRTADFAVYRASAGNAVAINMGASSADITTATVSPATTTMAADASSATFTVTGASVGETNLTVTANGIAALTIPVHVIADPDGPDETQSSVSPDSVTLNPGDSANGVILSVGRKVDVDTTFTITADKTSLLSFPATVTIPAGRSSTVVTPSIRAPATGYAEDTEIKLTFKDESNTFSDSTMYVTMIAPVIDQSQRKISFYNSSIGGTQPVFIDPSITEGGTVNIRVTLASQVSTDRTFTISSSNPLIANVSSTSIPVESGSSGFSFTVSGIDGAFAGSSVTITVRDDGGFYATETFTVAVANAEPEFKAPAGGAADRSALIGDPVLFPVKVEDKGVNDTLTLSWDFGDGSPVLTDKGPTEAQTHRFTEEGTYAVTIEATDKDGAATQATYNVTVTPSVIVQFSAEVPFGSVAARGGAYTATEFNFTNPEWGVTNSQSGFRFSPKRGITVAPVIPEGVYAVGWYVNSEEDNVAKGNVLQIVNPGIGATAFTAPEEGSYTIYHFSSWPYLPYKTLGYEEPFGDFDQDGLGDVWESTYLTNDVAQLGVSESFPNLSVARWTGDYGADGNMDGDVLPTGAPERITEVWFKYKDADGNWSTSADRNRGWIRYNGFFPEGTVDTSVDGWEETVIFVTNTVSVLEYPIQKINAKSNYGTTASDGESSSDGDSEGASGSDKPAFSNFEEFRGRPHSVTVGMPESLASDPDALAALADHPADWAAFNVEFRFASAVPSSDPATRGDSPATNPMLADTDNDKMSDGWETYFWSTVFHEVHPENWRAYDPTFRLYSSSSATAGIPLLMRNGGNARESEEIDYTLAAGFPVSDVPGAMIDYRNVLTVSGVVQVKDPLTGEFVGLSPITSLDGTIETATATGTVTLDPSTIDDLGYSVIWASGEKDGVPFCARLGRIDLVTGQYRIEMSGEVSEIFGTGFEGEGDAATFALPLKFTGYQADGVFSREALLAVFDPVVSAVQNPADLRAFVENAGYSPAKWNAASDTDNDGLSNYEEFALGTNPLHWDTDGDGMPDGWEVMNGLSPVSAEGDDGANGNPDGDLMYASDIYKHARAMVWDFDNATYWDGNSENEFVPSAATVVRSQTGWGKFVNLEEFLVAQYFIQLCGDSRIQTAFAGEPVSEVYPSDWAQNTTSPVKSDSNGNSLPDGWELYVGLRPVGKGGAWFVIEYSNRGTISCNLLLGFELHGESPEDVYDPDLDGLDWFDEFSFYNAGGPSIAESTKTIASSGTNAVTAAFECLKPLWTNKTHSTSPWNPDTDGDGLEDGVEYSDVKLGFNTNGDDGEYKWIVNFSPTSVDTDADGLPDAWEYLNGTYDTKNPLWVTGGAVGDGDSFALTNSSLSSGPYDTTLQFGPYGDPDGDGIPNYQEYLTAAVYGWRYDHWYSPDNTSLWMADPSMTASAVAVAATAHPEYGFDADRDAFPNGKSVHFRHYDPADFFRPAPRRALLEAGPLAIARIEANWGLSEQDVEAIATENGNDFDSDDVKLLRRAIAISNDPRFAALSQSDLLTVLQLISALPVKEFSYGRSAPAWDTVLTRQHEVSPMADNANGFEYLILLTGASPAWFANMALWSALGDFTYIPANFIGPAGFPGTYARNPDTDNDAMPDSWEIFHGLNPLYGNGHIVNGAGSHPDETEGTSGETLTDSSGVRHWVMSEDPVSVRVLSPVPGSRSFAPSPISREPTLFSGMGGYQAEAQPYDLFYRPWLSGDPYADPDQDGLSNLDESLNEMAPTLLHHTDPSPYWVTDTMDPLSHVNLYYASGSLSALWPWSFPIDSTVCNPPKYLFSFETNEGYDTDNDNIPDRAELAAMGSATITKDAATGHALYSDINLGGGSDPLDFDSPARRKALYLDGASAARTRNPFSHDKWTLAGYTAEFWFRAENPAAGHPQTLLDRPVWMPIDTSGTGPNPGWEVRHTFLAEIDSDGTLVARVDGDAHESTSEAASISIRAQEIVPNRWYHVALVLDPVAQQFHCIVDGSIAGSASCALKPCTGALFGSHYSLTTGTASYAQDLAGNATLLDLSVSNLIVAGYSPAPIVLGASDRNPWGVVAGEVDMNPWGLPSVAGRLRNPDFDPDRFFEGWIDEVRIWDRPRSLSEINASRFRRFTKADILAVNETRRKWDWQKLASASSLSEFPQKLLYHYSFDNLPDTADAAGREFDVPSYDTSVYPAGWGEISRIRPTPNIPWWGSLADTVRSSVYATDGGAGASYIPFIENTVAHLPQRPPMDLPLYRAAWNPNTLDLVGYRRADSSSWVFDHVDAGGGLASALASATATVYPEQIPNAMNPYGQVYFTAPGASSERNPNNYGGALDEFGLYEGVPVLSDMVPLLGAVADIDVPLWDDGGAGWEASAVDSDGDGLPDWWELLRRLDPNDASGASGAYGDVDGDGLDNWAEYMAGTDPKRVDTDGDGYSDYFSRFDGSSLTWGELFDDGDRIPNDWEAKNGLDPNRYDAEDDLDLDGWTNWEEYMAGSSPVNAVEFPVPHMVITYDYSGASSTTSSNATLVLETYSEKRTSLDPLARSWSAVSAQGGSHIAGASTWAQTGDPVHEMGGEFDGRYYTYTAYHRLAGVLNPEYQAELDGVRFNVIHLGPTHIDRASAVANMILELRAAKPKFTDNFGFTMDSLGNIISQVVAVDRTGQAWPATLKAENSEFGSFQPMTFMLDSETGEIVFDESGNKIAEWGLLLEYETGALYFGDAFKGLTYLTDAVTTPAFTVGSSTYPKTVDNLARETGHLRSGYNRFWGYLDGNGNGQFDVGEPAGLATEQPLLVSWNPVEATIPMTDGTGLFGFPRIDVSSSTNESDYVTVVMYRTGESNPLGRVRVRKPRNYIQEHDYLVNSVGLSRGIPFGANTYQTIELDYHDTDDITQPPFAVEYISMDLGFEDRGTMASGDSSMSQRRGRREMVPLYPVQKQTVYTSPVELKWRMDHRTMGIFVDIYDMNGATNVASGVYVPFPTPHGNPAENDFYYTCRPQLESGDGSFISLPSGLYRFTVTENLNSTSSSATAQKIYLECNLVLDSNDGVPDDPVEKREARVSYSVSGVVKYFGKTMVQSTLADSVVALDGTETSLADVAIPASVGELEPGTLQFQLVSGGEVVDAMSDFVGIGVTGNAFGILAGTGRETGAFASGSVNYADRTFSVHFKSGAVPAGSTIRLVRKAFPAGIPLVIQAFPQNAVAGSAAGVSGVPEAEMNTSAKGPYVLKGLSEGTYVIRAFLDSNGNGIADDWETQGFGVSGSDTSPVIEPDVPPILVDGDVKNIDIVLFDRDTDSDLLPDSWEALKFASAVAQSSALRTMYSGASRKVKDRMVLQWFSGYDKDAAGLSYWRQFADGELDSDPRTPDTDGDGLTDAMELLVTGTDTHRKDTDGDGLSDLEEFLSGSNPNVAEDAVPYTMPALAFDADGAPYVDCAYPALRAGTVLEFQLWRAPALDEAFEEVFSQSVAATNAADLVDVSKGGASAWQLPAGVMRMVPADADDTLDGKSGFFRIRVVADVGRVVENEDGTKSWWTWTVSEDGQSWSWTEAARGTGTTLERNAAEEWSFTEEPTGLPGTLVRDPGGSWRLID